MTAIESAQTTSSGPRSRARGNCIPRNLRAHHRQRVAVAHEVAGEEDRQRDLRDLAGLERATSPMPTQTPRAADLASDAGHERQQQQHDRDEPGRGRCSGTARGGCGCTHDRRDRRDDRDRAPRDLPHRARSPSRSRRRRCRCGRSSRCRGRSARWRSAAGTGRRRARRSAARCAAPNTSAVRPPPSSTSCVSIAPSAPSCTSAIADGVDDAREDEQARARSCAASAARGCGARRRGGRPARAGRLGGAAGAVSQRSPPVAARCGGPRRTSRR